MHPEVVEMCRRFAIQQIGYWRQHIGLPMARAHARKQALWWLAAAKGKRP